MNMTTQFKVSEGQGLISTGVSCKTKYVRAAPFIRSFVCAFVHGTRILQLNEAANISSERMSVCRVMNNLQLHATFFFGHIEGVILTTYFNNTKQN